MIRGFFQSCWLCLLVDAVVSPFVLCFATVGMLIRGGILELFACWCSCWSVCLFVLVGMFKCLCVALLCVG